LRTPDVLLRTVAIPYNPDEPGAVGGIEADGETGEHAADSHSAAPAGIPIRTLPSGVIH